MSAGPQHRNGARAARWLLALIALVFLVPVMTGLALTWRYPCWRYSNAQWCGHFCDDDPCACPDRAEHRDPYGSGPGCVP